MEHACSTLLLSLWGVATPRSEFARCRLLSITGEKICFELALAQNDGSLKQERRKKRRGREGKSRSGS